MGFTFEDLLVGNRDAWDWAYDWLFPEILAQLSAVSDPDAGLDLEQIAIDSFNKLPDRIGAITGGIEGLKPFAIATAMNQRRDELAKHNAQKRGSGKVESLQGQPPGTEYESESPTPYQIAEANERASLLAGALNQIPARYRAVVIDAYVLGLKYQEIARKRGLKIGSVGVYLDRGLEALKPILEEYGLCPSNQAETPLKEHD